MGKFSKILFASDLDGTLLNSSHQIDSGNMDAIRYFVENGGTFSIATGRPISAAQQFFSQLEINAPALLYNGGATYDTKSGRVLEMTALGADYIETAKDIMENFPDAGVEFHGLETVLISQLSALSEKHFQILNAPFFITPVDEINIPVIKGLITIMPERVEKLREYLLSKYGEKYSITTSMPFFVELTPKNVNKGTALAALAENLGFNFDYVAVIGDSPNDFEMMHASKLSFAPENAYEEIKRCAAYIVADNDNCAVADAIRVLDTHLS